MRRNQTGPTADVPPALSHSSLLRVSDFCRPRRRWLRNQRPARSCPVRVGVADVHVFHDNHSKSWLHQHQQQQQPYTSSSATTTTATTSLANDDPDTSAWCSSVDVLIQLSIVSSSTSNIVWLCRGEKRVPVVLIHAPSEQQQQQQQQQKDDDAISDSNMTLPTIINDSIHYDDGDDDPLLPIVWISPLAATCLGWQWNLFSTVSSSSFPNHQEHERHHHHEEQQHDPITTLDGCWVQVPNHDDDDDDDRMPRLAAEISLRPLANMNRSSLFLLQKRPDENDFQLYPPPPGRLVTRMGLVSSFRNGQATFYQVTRVIPEEEEESRWSQMQQHVGSNLVWRTTPRTRVVWDVTAAPSTADPDGGVMPEWTTVPRLPPLILASAYYHHHHHKVDPNNNQNGNGDPSKQSSPPQFLLPPHPDLKRLIHVWNDTTASVRMTSNSSYPPSKTGVVLHVVGTNHEHHVQVAIQAAANWLGRHYQGVFGWAAYAHATSSSSSTSSSNHTVSTGGWSDKVAGLQAALDSLNASSSLPCLLHLGDVDTELIDDHHDPELRHDQEARICHLLQSFLSAHTNKNHSWPTEQNRNDNDTGVTSLSNSAYFSSFSSYTSTPPVLVVVSTQRPLRPGPLLQYLTSSVSSCHPTSIQLSFPDARYGRYLWNDISGCKIPHPTIPSLRLDKDTQQQQQQQQAVDDCLVGRPVYEIVALREALARCLSSQPPPQQQDDDGDSSHILRLLREECHRLDQTKRKASAARIPNVSWDDVGGLSIVRQEIMDAIELPLQHPEWFADGRGRTGILLYGAPGTGKTLVAKAVATECGLPFLSVKGPELLGSYVGESEANVRATFLAAQKAALENKPHAAAVLFFDELDSLAPRRGGVGDGGGVMDRVVATLLVELDRTTAATTSKQHRVFCMGATNRPDLLDPSLLRPGRLDRLVYLGLASSDAERGQILAAQLRKIRLDPPDTFEVADHVAKQLPTNLTNADLASVVRNAVSISLRRLCRQADEELEQRRSVGGENSINLDDVLSEWEPNQLEPVVTVPDILEAIKTVVPSVTVEEIANYERLGDKLNPGLGK